MPKSISPLVAAAAALDDELRAYDELAQEARKATVNTEKGLQRAIRVVQESAGRNETTQEKLRALVAEIEAARLRQVESMTILLEAARTVQARAEQHDFFGKRFAALGESASHINTLTTELGARRSEGASESEVMEGLQAIQIQMAAVVAEAEALMTAARDQDWPELARQADAVRQQVLAAKNKLAIAQRSVATRAPS